MVEVDTTGRQVLVLAPIGKDSTLLCAMLDHVGIPSHCCKDLRSLCAQIELGADAVLVSEEALFSSDVALLVATIAAQGPWSDLPILIMTAYGASSPTVTRAVETLGNVTLLERPLQRATLISAVRAAKRASARQHQIRQYIREREHTAQTLREQSRLLARDIELRERMAASLRQSERLYRAIGESIDFGVWACDAQGRNTYASDSFLRLVGHSQEEVAGLGWTELLHPDDVAATVEAWRQCTENGAAWDREHRFLGVDGRYHPVLARGVPLHDEAGVVTGWAGINLDIARIKSAEEQLRDVDRRKDEFLATLAHELRNPLAPVRNAVSVLSLTGQHDPTVLWAREMIDRQVRQLARLVDDLLDVARISRGKVQLRREPVLLSEVIRAAVETANPMIESADHRLHLSVPDAVVALNGDSVRLSQCIANLLTNAAKYTPQGGQITLSASVHEDLLELRVRDSGIGIEPQALGSIFEMFNQVDRSLERSQGGLGIGLTLVKSFVEMHGGKVEAISAGQGRGSEFVVRLPIVVPRSCLEGQEPEKFQGRGRRWRVLVVDDNRDSAESIARLLELCGSQVHCEHDGLGAVAAAARLAPDLILLDIGLPNINGFEAATRIRALPGGRRCCIVAMTGWGQEHDRQRSRDAGFDHHLTKPVDLAQLMHVMEILCPAAVA